MAAVHRQSFFTRFAKGTARLAGRPVTFAFVVVVVIAWALAGPFFGFSDTWQLAINTATTIVTFLMVFLIQATQNRDAEAIQIKLDEIIRSQDRAHNALLDLEELEEDDLVKVREEYLELADAARKSLSNGEADTGVPDLPPMRRRAGDRKGS
ncbi:MAG TPA: low affinity iron permease family protein [Usitatibacter sp.]|jgi:low affinity Fe/Cu permease|nr:low affinity iron permease family protein [Usitatibacter sp.]